MKTTIKTGTADITIEPMKLGANLICLCIKTGSQMISVPLTPDQSGVLIFGIEQANRENGQ